jgi:hypothetical protein
VSSAKLRLCERNWHWRHIDARIGELVGSCLGDLRALIAMVESKMDLTVCLKTGCMAALVQRRHNGGCAIIGQMFLGAIRNLSCI